MPNESDEVSLPNGGTTCMWLRDNQTGRWWDAQELTATLPQYLQPTTPGWNSFEVRTNQPGEWAFLRRYLSRSPEHLALVRQPHVAYGALALAARQLVE